MADYTSAACGKVGAPRSDTVAEPGDVLMFLLFDKPGPAPDQDYPE